MQYHGKRLTIAYLFPSPYTKYSKSFNFTSALPRHRITFNWHYYVRQRFMTKMFASLRYEKDVHMAGLSFCNLINSHITDDNVHFHHVKCNWFSTVDMTASQNPKPPTSQCVLPVRPTDYSFNANKSSFKYLLISNLIYST